MMKIELNIEFIELTLAMTDHSRTIH